MLFPCYRRKSSSTIITLILFQFVSLILAKGCRLLLVQQLFNLHSIHVKIYTIKIVLSSYMVWARFLGVELLPTANGMFLSQQYYIQDILQKGNIIDAKPVGTPMSTTCSLSSHDDTPSCDSSLFRSIIESLHYLSITRPDVAFTVNKLSQYM